ncbi:hypothetical protein [Dankookia rubra]|nr:hypothetical protein [Dankookia rubra]
MATAVAPSSTGITTVFRPGRCRMANGTWTVMLVAMLMLRPSARWARWR